MKAVRFDHYGDIDVLEVREVPRPTPKTVEGMVEVKAAGINPGEAAIREGALDHLLLARFPSGGAGEAEDVVAPAEQVTQKPAGVTWDVAGCLFVEGTTVDRGKCGPAVTADLVDAHGELTHRRAAPPRIAQ